jgi:hypothetical protein
MLTSLAVHVLLVYIYVCSLDLLKKAVISIKKKSRDAGKRSRRLNS